ncbi:MAG: hypothetical protein ABSB75_01700 [Candidatus Limnocylindrales bacterium]
MTDPTENRQPVTGPEAELPPQPDPQPLASPPQPPPKPRLQPINRNQFLLRPIDVELARADRALLQLGGRVLAVEAVALPGLEDHVLAVIEKTGETPPEFPRDPTARRRHPL